jgi:peroxiredoxin Q/BCP
MVKVGDMAPDFEVLDHTGHTVTLSEHFGKSVVLWFYPAADTPGCTAEGCGFRDLAADYQRKNAVILGVSFDTVEANNAFAEKFSFRFQLLCDTERKLGLAYGACSNGDAPSAKRIGVIIGPDGMVKHYYDTVDAKSFPEQAIAAI